MASARRKICPHEVCCGLGELTARCNCGWEAGTYLAFILSASKQTIKKRKITVILSSEID